MSREDDSDISFVHGADIEIRTNFTRDQSTNDLEVIRKYPNRYTWGKVIKIHEIGRYHVVEYSCKGYGKEGEEVIHFSIYIDGNCNGYGHYVSLDEALVSAVTYANIKNINEARWMAIAAVQLAIPKVDKSNA